MAKYKPLCTQTAAGGFIEAHREENDHGLLLPCVSSCDAIMRLMLSLRLFFHASHHGCCHGEVVHEWKEVIWVTVSETPALLFTSETKPSSQPEIA